MHKDYKKRLTILTIILVVLITVLVFYYIWKIDDDNKTQKSTSCVDIIYSDELTYNLVNPEALKDSDGKSSSVRSISITNKCSDIKTIQLYLDVLNTSTINSNKIKTYINGDITLEPTLLSDLKTLKNSVKEKVAPEVYQSYEEQSAKFGANEAKVFKNAYDSIKSADRNYFEGFQNVRSFE